MDIHQMQVVYDAREDRLLWQLRTHQAQWFGIWLTRRLTLRLWEPFQRLVLQAEWTQVPAGQATVLPEAREMMAEVARQRPLPQTDFKAPFVTDGVTRPLGPDPLLPDAVDLTPGPETSGRSLHLRIRETGGRNLELKLTSDMATGLMRLLEQALKTSEWITPVPLSATGQAAAPAAGQRLS